MPPFSSKASQAPAKTTLERMLAKAYPDAEIVTEGTTLMPLINNRDPIVARDHLTSVTAAWRSEGPRLRIVDRFHLTHAFRTGASLHDFSTIEDGLHAFGDMLLVLLVVDPARIKSRIEETAARRSDAWKKGAQGSLDEK